MNRRLFLGTLLGTAVATALPSEIFPFRKIFLPAKKVYSAPTLIELPPGLMEQTKMFLGVDWGFADAMICQIWMEDERGNRKLFEESAFRLPRITDPRTPARVREAARELAFRVREAACDGPVVQFRAPRRSAVVVY